MTLIIQPNERRSLIRKIFKEKRHLFVQQLSLAQLRHYEQDLIKRFLQENPLDSSDIIGAYWALPDEFPTQGFIQHCLHHTIPIALP